MRRQAVSNPGLLSRRSVHASRAPVAFRTSRRGGEPRTVRHDLLAQRLLFLTGKLAEPGLGRIVCAGDLTVPAEKLGVPVVRGPRGHEGPAGLPRRGEVPAGRVNVSVAGIHVYNRDGMTTATDPFDLYPRLDLLQGDALHAFYMGVELGRAQIAWQLASFMCRTSPSNGAVPCVPRRPRIPRARTPRARP